MNPERLRNGRVFMKATVVIQPEVELFENEGSKARFKNRVCAFCDTPGLIKAHPLVTSLGKEKVQIGLVCMVCRDLQIDTLKERADRILGKE